MRKKNWIILLIIILLIGVLFLYLYFNWLSYKGNVGKIIKAKSNNREVTATYTSDKFGYQFSYPSNYSLAISKDQKNITIPSSISTFTENISSIFKKELRSFESTTYIFYINIFPSINDIDQYIKDLQEEETNIKEINKITINNNTYYCYYEPSWITNPPYHHLISNGKIIVDIQTLEIDKETYINTLKSFKFIN